MSAYRPDQQVMTPDEMGIALTQHKAQNSLALVNGTADDIFNAMRTAAVTKDAAQYSSAMSQAWEGVSKLHQLAVREHQGFLNGHALSMSLVEQVMSLLRQLSDPTYPRDDMDGAIQAFADRVESETMDAAQDLMVENIALAMPRTFDISEDDAKVFALLLFGGVETGAARVLGQMLPQLEMMHRKLSAAS